MKVSYREIMIYELILRSFEWELKNQSFFHKFFVKNCRKCKSLRKQRSKILKTLKKAIQKETGK